MREKSRLTIDMSPDEHMYLKMACAKIGVSMKDFLLQLAFEKIEDMEDVRDADEAHARYLKEGGISLKKLKKDLGL